MSQPIILFAVPTYSGSPAVEFLPSYIETMSALGSAGIGSALCMVPFDPYLGKVRNRIAMEFLVNYPMATHLFFLDDDIGWPGAKVVEFIQRDLDVIAGVYPKKTDAGEFPCQLEVEGDQFVQKDGLLKAKLAPTGFLCIKRHVMEKMAAVSGQYYDTTRAVDPLLHWNIFDNGFFMPDGSVPLQQGGLVGEFWGEDYYFCRKWRDMGGEIWVDPNITFTHRGAKAWTGNLHAALVAASKPATPENPPYHHLGADAEAKTP